MAISGLIDLDASGWITWKAPTVNAAALPTSGNLDGDVRITLNDQSIYVWKSATSSWIQAATPAATSAITALLGDVSAVGPGAVMATLATVNASPGTYTNATLTVNGKGLVTSASSGSAPEVPLTFSTGLTRTVNTITANISTGIAGGQTAIGGTGASENLTLSSTSNATKGKILFGTSAYDEVNNRLGIGTASPTVNLDIVGTTAQPLLLTGSAGGGWKIGQYSTSATYGAIYTANVTPSTTNMTLYGNGTETYLNYITGGFIRFTRDNTTTSATITATGLNIGTAAAAIGQLTIPIAPSSSANFGLVSLGSGPFDGSTSGFYTGTASGTLIAGNLASGSLADPINLQIAGVPKLKQLNDGRLAINFNSPTVSNARVLTINTATGTPGIIGFYHGGTETALLSVSNSGAGRFDYDIGGTVRANISGNGNFTVGDTTNSSTVARFDVLGASLTGSLDTGILNLRQTWNTTGTPTAVKLNVTDTASNASSLLMDLQVGGTSKFKVEKDGDFTANGVAGSSGAYNFTGYSVNVQRLFFNNGTVSNFGGIKSASDGNFNFVNAAETASSGNVSLNRLTSPNAPSATANFGLVSLGSGPFDGSTSGFFTGSSNGTVHAINAASGFTGDIVQWQLAGSSRFTVTSAGNVTASATITGTNLQAGVSSNIRFSGSTRMTAPSDGILKISNAAETDFTRLQFGGTTSSFPSLKRSGTTLIHRLADDSADAPMIASTVKASSAAGYISSDGSTGATGTFTSADAKTITVKDGIITSIV